MDNLVTSLDVFLAMLILWAIGSIGSLLLGNNDKLANWWGSIFAIFGAGTGLAASLAVLIFNSTFSLTIPSTLPFLSISFRVDKLSAFFIFIISLIALMASIYALGYVKHYYRQYNIGTLGFFYNFFLIGMVMVVSANNALFFIIVWEIMSVASYFLVIFENKKKESVKAGSLYISMTNIGTAFIILAFLILYSVTGSFDFNIMKENIGAAAPLLKNIVFILALVGFGSKAGIIPFHIWLPSAHPAAPSHVSALMSGVMIKTGVYMFIRIFMDIMPNAPLWWGVVVLILGAVSALLGVLYALTQHDIKKLLAYHSIENVGIILLGLGGSMIFWSLNMIPLAALSLTAALFHTLNHAIFKSLLFMGAGSVIAATHTGNMEEYGGLIKYMPVTAFFFLAGSMAISALPPLNGFYSEWLTYQSLFAGIGATDMTVRWIFMLGAVSLAFTGGLAAMCFVKVFGITFLARPRSEAVRHTKETGITPLVGMAALAALTLIVGLFSGPLTNIISGVAKNLAAFTSSKPALHATALKIGVQNNVGVVSVPLILAGLIIATLFTFLLVAFVTRNRHVKIGATWDCGTTLEPRMEITATGFAYSIVAIFRGILRPTKQEHIEYRDDDTRYFNKSKAVEVGTSDVYQIYFYRPAYQLVIKISKWAKKIQSGNINMYILYIFLILIIWLLKVEF